MFDHQMLLAVQIPHEGEAAACELIAHLRIVRCSASGGAPDFQALWLWLPSSRHWPLLPGHPTLQQIPSAQLEDLQFNGPKQRRRSSHAPVGQTRPAKHCKRCTDETVTGAQYEQANKRQHRKWLLIARRQSVRGTAGCCGAPPSTPAHSPTSPAALRSASASAARASARPSTVAAPAQLAPFCGTNCK